jgi:poly(A) polymerase
MGRNSCHDRQPFPAAVMARLELDKAAWHRQDGMNGLLDALGAGEGQCRYVGGVVRDSLKGLTIKDIDVATTLLPEQMIARLEAIGIKAIPTGIAHGTITAVLPHGHVEVTTLRRDVATDGRRATIAYTDDWHEDAARRDFTINALYADPETGDVTDFFGGLADLEHGVVRFIGDPLTRIAEDHLRILRFFRFHARFGKHEPDTASLSACAARAKDLMALSRERIADELLKVLGLPQPPMTVELMFECGIFAQFLPEVTAEALPALRTLVDAEAVSGISPDPLRRLAALLPPDPQVAETVAMRLKLSNAARKYLAALAARNARDCAEPRALAYRAGHRVARDRLLLAGIIADALNGWTAPAFPLSGKDIIAQGIRPGPEVARLLKTIEDQWISEGFPASERLSAIQSEVLAR